MGKAGYHLPRTISSAISTSTIEPPEPVPISNTGHTHSTATPHTDIMGSIHRSRKRGQRESPHPPLFRIGGSVIPPRSPSDTTPGVGQPDEPERPVSLVLHDSVPEAATAGEESARST